MRHFDCFGSYNEVSHISWPLCYVKAIMGCWFSFQNLSPVALCITALDSFVALDVQSGKDWEMIVVIALCLRYFLQQNNGHGCPFGLVPSGKKSTFHFVKLPENVSSLDGAMDEMALFRPNTVSLVYPTCSQFVKYDTIVVYTDGDKKQTSAGLQMKTPNEYPDAKDIADARLTGGSYWIRRAAPVTSRTHAGEWIYLDIGQVRDMLGYSLSFLVPLTRS